MTTEISGWDDGFRAGKIAALQEAAFVIAGKFEKSIKDNTENEWGDGFNCGIAAACEVLDTMANEEQR